jgi:ribonuclease-3
MVATQTFHSLEKQINIHISDKKLLENVFVHRSYLNEHRTFPLPSNEKLEFLGDSVLSLSTSIYLFQHYPHLEEGDYTDIKASIVRTESLAGVAREINLGTYLYLSKGEERGNGRDNTNILADCFEALIACVFIDKGFDTAYEFIKRFLFTNQLDTIVQQKLYLSPKSRLQEIIQGIHKVLPTYAILDEKGPEHKKLFRVAVYLNDSEIGTGSGSSKKSAEEAAAKNALEKFGTNR